MPYPLVWKILMTEKEKIEKMAYLFWEEDGKKNGLSLFYWKKAQNIYFWDKIKIHRFFVDNSIKSDDIDKDNDSKRNTNR